jgi:hypothetical protein
VTPGLFIVYRNSLPTAGMSLNNTAVSKIMALREMGGGLGDLYLLLILYKKLLVVVTQS